MTETKEVALYTWGRFACFSRPESKVERLTYPVPTPSAMRGLLSAVYSKPKEFYWQVRRVEVLKKPSYIAFKRNEVKEKLSAKGEVPVYVDSAGGDGNKGRTQRQTVALKDVAYRVYAEIRKNPGFCGTEEQLYCQALRRIRRGQCFYQPSFGLREFTAYFREAGEADAEPPIDLDLDLGLMLYDVFDLHSDSDSGYTKPYVTLFHARLKRGVLEVPDFDSPEVLRPEVTKNVR